MKTLNETKGKRNVSREAHGEWINSRRHEPRIAGNIWIGINSPSSSLIPEYAVNMVEVDVPSTVFASSL